MASGGFKGGYEEETLMSIAVIAKRYGVKHIRIESNFGDGMYTRLITPVLSRIYPCTTEDFRSSKQKELRIIDTLEPVLNGHKLVVSPELIREDIKGEDREYQLFYQLTRITKDKGSLLRDDRLDALAGAVGYWTEMLGTDQTSVEEMHREELLRQEIEKFIDSDVFGVASPRSTTWTSTYGSLKGLKGHR